jgi:hypothetical protein
MRLVEIGEQPSIKNYSIMKNAVQLVNTFGGDFPSELKPKLDIIIYKILRSMSMQQDQQPVSNVHHYYHEQKDGQTMYQMVEQMREDIKTIKNKILMQQQQSKDIDTKHNEQQQGDSTVQQDTA